MIAVQLHNRWCSWEVNPPPPRYRTEIGGLVHNLDRTSQFGLGTIVRIYIAHDLARLNNELDQFELLQNWPVRSGTFERIAVFFLPCSKCGRRGHVCSLTVMRFKPYCEHCGHSAACHNSRRVCPSCVILLIIAALLAGSVALFGNLRQTATASAGVPASAEGLPVAKD
jgi:hypothetical protein